MHPSPTTQRHQQIGFGLCFVLLFGGALLLFTSAGTPAAQEPAKGTPKEDKQKTPAKTDNTKVKKLLKEEQEEAVPTKRRPPIRVDEEEVEQSQAIKSPTDSSTGLEAEAARAKDPTVKEL